MVGGGTVSRRWTAAVTALTTAGSLVVAGPAWAGPGADGRDRPRVPAAVRAAGPQDAERTRTVTLITGDTVHVTGKRVEVRGMEVVRVGPDEKIVLNTLYYDNLGVAAQLGLVPEGASVGSESS